MIIALRIRRLALVPRPPGATSFAGFPAAAAAPPSRWANCVPDRAVEHYNV
jgi:hypothetical protein